MRFPLVPTARTAWLVALAAPLALVLAAAVPGAWVAAPAAGAALIVLVLLDALLTGRLDHWDLALPGDGEVGEPLAVRLRAAIAARASAAPVEAAIACDPRLAAGGVVELPLAGGDSGVWTGTAQVRPTRRGTAALTDLWLRWAGPLGLGARQVRLPLDRRVRVWPDLAPVRSPELQFFLRDAQFGLIARRIRGEGTQFEALAEYEPGMDRRRIDWKASARHTRLYARENESERNNQIVFAFDCGQAMCEPVDGLPRIDRAVTAALTAAYVALKGGDRVALFGFARHPEVMTPFVADPRAFHQLQSAAAGLDYHAEEPNFVLALATLTARLRRRSLVVLFSDFTDPTGAELMLESIGRLVERHLVLVVTMEDTELAGLRSTEPATLADLAIAITADTLVRQRTLVLQRLRALGVDVLEAPYGQIGYRLIDRYLEIKRKGAIG